MPRQWSLANQQDSLTRQLITFTITEPGLHTLRIWQREDGLRLDRIVLTTNPLYEPQGDGPPASSLSQTLRP